MGAGEPSEQLFSLGELATRAEELERGHRTALEVDGIDADDVGARSFGRTAKRLRERLEGHVSFCLGDVRRRQPGSLELCGERGRSRLHRPRDEIAPRGHRAGNRHIRPRRGCDGCDEGGERLGGVSLLEQVPSGSRQRFDGAGLNLVSDPRHRRIMDGGTAGGGTGRACGHPQEGRQSGLIASPAPKRPLAEDPPINPMAVPRAVAQARARRRARLEHRREVKRARFRFLVLLGILVFVTLFLSLSIWEKIQAAFGL
jgi:hypothetical protein